ncbi:MAG: hypothetical protein ACOC5F_01745 [Candidatus Aminicenantaceae bacterium]
MKKKSLYAVGIVIVIFGLISCSSSSEESFLKSYFNAVSLNDLQTMSTMALQPLAVEVKDWEIVEKELDTVEPAVLPELDKKQKELKKKLNDHIGPTLDAQEKVYEAQDELKYARTPAARRAARSKINKYQAQYEEEKALHSEMQKEFNEAKSKTAKEEEITLSSLGLDDLPNVRSLEGGIHKINMIVKITSESGMTRNYRFYMRKYELEDEELNITHRGRWIITKFEVVG